MPLILALLCLVLYVLIILPGHWQIRSVPIIIPDAESLDRALDSVPTESMPRSITYINTAQQRSPFGHLGHVALVLRWADGRSFLIDTGMNASEAIAFGKPLELLGAAPTETFAPVEAQLGPDIDDISGIGFTHLHTDHVAGIARICAAMASAAPVFQTVDQHRLHNLHTSEGQALVSRSGCPVTVLDEGNIKPLPGFPGLFAIPAGGHTPGSTLFATRVDGHTWIFAGDITNTVQDIHSNRGKGFFYSYLLIPEDVDLLARWRQWLSRQDTRDQLQVLVAHDIEAYHASNLEAWQP